MIRPEYQPWPIGFRLRAGCQRTVVSISSIDWMAFGRVVFANSRANWTRQAVLDCVTQTMLDVILLGEKAE
jgi:hypothetical protein